MFLVANSITDEGLKRATFLSTIGGAGYKLLRSLVGSEVKSRNFDDLVKVLQDHVRPQANMIAQRFHFFKRDRKTGESMNEYVAELRHLSEHCVFGDQLNDYLHDRFVCGLNSQAIQQKLLSAKDLKLDSALDIARSCEAASRDSKLIGAAMPSGSHEVHAVGGVHNAECEEVHRLGHFSNHAKSNSTRECYRCGKPDHLANECPYKGYNCRKCGKVGHMKKTCRSAKDARSTKPKTAEVRQVCICQHAAGGQAAEDENVQEDAWDPLGLYSLDRQFAVDPVVVEIQLNGKSGRMEVDTGAAVSVMSVSCYNMVRALNEVLESSSLKLKTCTGELVSPEGVGQVEVKYQDQTHNLPITVVKGNVPRLMGRDWLSKLQLKWGELFLPQRPSCRGWLG
jgi:hypothetical protein